MQYTFNRSTYSLGDASYLNTHTHARTYILVEKYSEFLSKDVIEFQGIFEIWHLAWLVLYQLPSRLGEHSVLVRFEKRVAEMLQHGQKYGVIVLLYGMKNTYEWVAYLL